MEKAKYRKGNLNVFFCKENFKLIKQEKCGPKKILMVLYVATDAQTSYYIL